MTKNLVFGILLPLFLIAGGIASVMLLSAPEPPKSRLANPENEAELLEFLPSAEVAEVKALSDALDVDVSGSVVPYRELQIAAEVAGRIVEKDPLVRSGNYVHKGQVLYRIDPRDYKLELERLQRKHKQELASINELEQDIKNTERLIEVASQQLKLSDTDVERMQNLGSNFSSASELDEARRTRLTNMNSKVTLENQLRAFETRRTSLELAAQLVETEIEKAQMDFERTVIRSPVDGRVVSESVEEDSFVQRGTQLLVIEDTEKVEVACNLRMDQLTWVLEQPASSADRLVSAAQAWRYELPDTPAEVRFRIAGRDSTELVWNGTLDRIDGTGLDPQSRTVPIRILVEDPGKFTTANGTTEQMSGAPMLVRGMFVDVTIKARPTTPLLLVPKLAIKPATNSNVIWKFREDRSAIRSTSEAKKAIETYETAQAEGTVEELFGGDKQISINPDDWSSGYLEIVHDVRMVTAYWGDESVAYWVCEVPGGELEPGDKVIVSPLPGMKADGTDPVRIKLANESGEEANVEPGNGDTTDALQVSDSAVDSDVDAANKGVSNKGVSNKDAS